MKSPIDSILPLAEEYAEAYIKGKDAPSGITGAFELQRLIGVVRSTAKAAPGLTPGQPSPQPRAEIRPNP